MCAWIYLMYEKVTVMGNPEEAKWKPVSIFLKKSSTATFQKQLDMLTGS